VAAFWRVASSLCVKNVNISSIIILRFRADVERLERVKPIQSGGND